jgi:hypothetical protein
VSAEPSRGSLCSLVYPTKSVYYALSIEGAGRSRICPGLEMQEFHKNKDFAGSPARNSVSFAILAHPRQRTIILFLIYVL